MSWKSLTIRTRCSADRLVPSVAATFLAVIGCGDPYHVNPRAEETPGATDETLVEFGSCGNCEAAGRCITAGQFTFQCASNGHCVAHSTSAGAAIDVVCAYEAAHESPSPSSCSYPTNQCGDLSSCYYRQQHPTGWVVNGGATAWSERGGEIRVGRTEILAAVSGRARRISSSVDVNWIQSCDDAPCGLGWFANCNDNPNLRRGGPGAWLLTIPARTLVHFGPNGGNPFPSDADFVYGETEFTTASGSVQVQQGIDLRPSPSDNRETRPCNASSSQPCELSLGDWVCQDGVARSGNSSSNCGFSLPAETTAGMPATAGGTLTRVPSQIALGESFTVHWQVSQGPAALKLFDASTENHVATAFDNAGEASSRLSGDHLLVVYSDWPSVARLVLFDASIQVAYADIVVARPLNPQPQPPSGQHAVSVRCVPPSNWQVAESVFGGTDSDPGVAWQLDFPIADGATKLVAFRLIDDFGRSRYSYDFSTDPTGSGQVGVPQCSTSVAVDGAPIPPRYQPNGDNPEGKCWYTNLVVASPGSSLPSNVCY